MGRDTWLRSLHVEFKHLLEDLFVTFRFKAISQMIFNKAYELFRVIWYNDQTSLRSLVGRALIECLMGRPKEGDKYFRRFVSRFRESSVVSKELLDDWQVRYVLRYLSPSSNEDIYEWAFQREDSPVPYTLGDVMEDHHYKPIVSGERIQVEEKYGSMHEKYVPEPLNWNMTRVRQEIGKSIRHGRHGELVPEERDVSVMVLDGGHDLK